MQNTRKWSAVVIGLSLPMLMLLCWTLWTEPFSMGETVSILEDVADRPLLEFFSPTGSYYRPVYFMVLSALWNTMPSLEAMLSAVRLLHIVPVLLVVALVIQHARPQTAVDSAAVLVAIAVLLGSPGFIDNIELPLSYTIVGMAAILITWTLMEREYRAWHAPVIVVMTLVAIGFKEQGLILVPVILVAWWAGAQGTGRVAVASVVVLGVAYVLMRLILHDASLPMFEQDVGFGFGRLSPGEAEARFGGFPLWLYAYSAASTISNVLFAEPTGGVFGIVASAGEGMLEPWQVVHLLSSVALTGVITWWGVSALERRGPRPWSPEARLAIVTLVALLASGALSFNYSRDRLGGMAVVFYALSAFHAIRFAVNRIANARSALVLAGAMLLVVVAASWQVRALYTLEYKRLAAVKVQREWLIQFDERRSEFAALSTRLGILESMAEQGTEATVIYYTPYPRWLIRMLGEL